MKVTVERSELLRSLGHVHRVVERRNTIPILANVLIRAEGAGLSLKATDLDLEVIETIAAEASPGGSTTVPAHMFHDIVRKLPEGADVELRYTAEDPRLSVSAGRSRTGSSKGARTSTSPDSTSTGCTPTRPTRSTEPPGPSSPWAASTSATTRPAR